MLKAYLSAKASSLGAFVISKTHEWPIKAIYSTLWLLSVAKKAIF